MCNACGFPAAPGHWTEAGTDTAHDRLRERFRRVAVLAKLLRPMGISVHDGGLVPGIQVTSSGGASTIVANLEDLWVEIERLTGRAFDPLEP